MTIGTAAKRLGIAASALRFYERQGLHRPAQRGNAGYRLYSSADLQALQFVRSAQAAGFTLADIRFLLGLASAEASEPKQPRVQRLIEQRLQELERRMADLRRVRASLRRALNRCRACAGQCNVIDDLRGNNKGEER